MTVKFPRISIIVDDDRGMGTQGELSALSLGFGIHQAWIYTTMFGTTTIFPAPSSSVLVWGSGSSISLVFLASLVTFALSLLFAAATDQKYLRFYTAKRVLLGATVLTAGGTFAIFASPIPGTIGIAASLFAGITTGMGSALLLLFWGIAYSRNGSASIVINTAVAIVIAMSIYSFVLHIVPVPFSGVLAACLPLLELPLLWRLTPTSYAVRHAVPIFNPLPVRKGPFAIRLGVPVLLFGFALGALRSVSTQVILPSSDLTTQLLALFAGGAATILLLVTVFSIDKRGHWDFLFRPIIPFIAVTLFFLPTLTFENSMVAPLVLLTGYMCFESLMWVFFSEMSQEFRLSPIFLFGTGRGCLALGSLAGSLAIADPTFLDSLTPFGHAGGAILIMFTMVTAYALLPRVRDIKRIIMPQEPTNMSSTITAFNRQSESIIWKTQRPVEGGSPLGKTRILGAADMFNSTDTTPRGGTGISQHPETPIVFPSEPKAAATHSHPWHAHHQADSARPHDGTWYAEEQSRKRGRFRTQCEIIANRYLLSRRETEVMFLLAKGHNAAYIQDKLCISRSTAKTHISHIYRKLNIHNQQELLAMVEDARDGRY